MASNLHSANKREGSADPNKKKHDEQAIGSKRSEQLPSILQ